MKPLLAKLKPSSLRSVPVNDDPSHRIRTEGKDSGVMSTPKNGENTLYEISSNAFRRFADLKCMGTRKYLGMKSVKPPVKEFGETIWKTYEQVGEDVMKFGAALRSAGLVAAPKKATLDAITTPCSLAIFGKFV